VASGCEGDFILGLETSFHFFIDNKSKILVSGMEISALTSESSRDN
jgi:hypothetical protein